MKRIFTISVAVLLTVSMFAQSPEKISYQAVIRNSSNQLVTNREVGMQISILQGSGSGTAVYAETQTPTTNANGLVTIEIGTGSTSDDFAAIDWTDGPYFIKTETDPAGGTGYTITGTSQLLSVPYALHAKTAGLVTGTITETQNLSDVISINNFANGQIKNVTDPTDAQDAATKAYVDTLKKIIYEELLDAGLNGIVRDIEGNTYKTIKIGDQVWMADNLRTAHFNDGSPVFEVTDNSSWQALSTPAYCWYNNDSITYAQTYGALYNWYTVETGNLCPDGWHVPDNEEWITLQTYCGGSSSAGGSLKETDTVHWKSPNTGATNETNFTALPGGYREINGIFLNIGNEGSWWSATGIVNDAWYIIMSYFNSGINILQIEKKSGSSVRCVRD